ncbi:MAG TPA: hypothetical protein VGM94_03150 [Galbitalea sp.]|jgi:hypothetical protein
MTRRALIDVVASTVGAGLVFAALVIIWVARLSIPRPVYVSELGASDMSTAKVFELALLLIVAGGTLIAFAGKDIRSRVRFLAIWTPSVSLWVASGFFLVASQVTCTPGCPLPVGPAFDWQDVTHITCATLAFFAACVGMLQSAFADHHRILARFSLVMAIAVGVVSGVGGLCSLARFQVDFGSSCELVATTLAIAWVIVFGVSIGARRILALQRPAIRSSSRFASPTST